MGTLGFIATSLTLAAGLGFLNTRFLRLPSTIGILVIALFVSLAVIVLDSVVEDLGIRDAARRFLMTVDFPAILLDGALSVLLFAGSLHVDFDQLWSRRWTVFSLATAGTFISVALLASAMWLVFASVGPPVPLTWCVVLGALLAPTDPVAVVGLLKRIGLPPALQAVFAGESLFNDGVGVVVFAVALDVAKGDQTPHTAISVASRLLIEAAGGGALGLAAGWLAIRMIRTIDEYNLELTISLALATGIYSLANFLHTSGPIAVVFAGLMVGGRTGRRAMSDVTHQHVATFWSLLDELFNLLLFLLIGLEMVSISITRTNLIAAVFAIPLALIVRAISVFVPTFLLHFRTPNKLGSLAVLTWGGLRGGISVALALALPASDAKTSLLTVCYVVVVFSVIVQGLTMQRLATWLFATPSKLDQSAS